MPRRLRTGPLLFGWLGLCTAFLPSSVLDDLVSDVWEVELLRFLGLVAAAVALLWSWAIGQGGAVATRLRRWVGPAAVALVAYAFTAVSVYLVLSFCLLVGAALGTGLERANLASQRAWDRLEDESRRRRGE